MLADEVVREVKAGSVEGDWPVEIHKLEGKLLFTGRLSSVRLGEALRFEWAGRFVDTGAEGRFIGIGLVLNNELIVASFEQVALKEPST